jgi:GDPmannose 4,6-dehydratase
MWRMLQQDKPDDYVLATGETRTVREFVDLTFKQVNIKLNWEGKGIDEKGIDSASDKVLVQVNPAYFRLTEVDLLIGDPTKAKEILGWQSQTKLEELVKVMVKSDWEKVKRRGY